jgi:hypothetical protein
VDKKITAVLATDATTTSLLPIITGLNDKTVTVDGTLVFAKDDPIRNLVVSLDGLFNDPVLWLYNANVAIATQNVMTSIYNKLVSGIDVFVSNGIAPASDPLPYVPPATDNEWNKFAGGGAFTNSIVSSPTSFDMGLMGEAGPEAIMPLANINGSLGVRFAGNSANDALVEEIKALRQEVAQLRRDNSAENQAIASSSNKTAKLIDRAMPDGNTLAVSASIDGGTIV